LLKCSCINLFSILLDESTNMRPNLFFCHEQERFSMNNFFSIEGL
jgi:hypothetical protein